MREGLSLNRNPFPVPTGGHGSGASSHSCYPEVENLEEAKDSDPKADSVEVSEAQGPTVGQPRGEERGLDAWGRLKHF